MQKPKNLLPGLFLCVFSRIPELLVDFYCSNLLAFPFFIWGRLFLPERKVLPAHFIQAHFAHRFPKNPAPPRKGPTQKTPGASSTPKRAFGNTHPKGPPRAPRIYKHAALFGMPPRPKGPRFGTPPQPLKNYPFGALYRKPCLVYAHKRPHAKTPGVSPGVWLMKSSFNLRLTHCGLFLAGCTGPACSRRPQ